MTEEKTDETAGARKRPKLKGAEGPLARIVRKDPLFFAVVALFAIVLLAFALDVLVNDIRTSDRQDALQPFYTPPSPLPEGNPGDIIRSEPLGIDIPGAHGLRILYLTEQADGTRRAASGMVFYPDTPVPAGGRPMVAWAHPTVGMDRQYAPSRTENPVSDMTWLKEMIARGWVVTATDYAGLGTPGVQHYLVGRDEARDVLNSVRAARLVEAAGANSTYAVWGHSQGGHAALFTALETGRLRSGAESRRHRAGGACSRDGSSDVRTIQLGDRLGHRATDRGFLADSPPGSHTG